MSIKFYVCDDFTGEPGATTFTFGLGDSQYEIDLASDADLQAALAPFVAVARKAPRASSGGHTGGPNLTPEQRRENKAIREWAAAGGLNCPPRGMIPRQVRAAYEAAQGKAL
jgi:hypothetical protein